MVKDLAYTYVDSPVGPLLLAGRSGSLQLISFPGGSRARRPDPRWHRDDELFTDAAKQLTSYFEGRLQAFSLPLTMTGTDFQKAVWTELTTIPFGATVSYGALARAIGKPSASRAVGAANGANPLPIVVPCHRVIGSNKTLTGFGGGLDTKRFLLELEGAMPDRDTRQAELFVS